MGYSSYGGSGGGGGGGNVATDAIWNAKGDLAVGTGPDTAASCAVGTNGQVLMADSTQTDGVKWSTLTAASVGADAAGAAANAQAASQPLDSDLTTIAALTATTDSILQAKGSAWAARTIAQVKADLGLTGTNSGDQTITLTGDVTGSGAGSFAATLKNTGPGATGPSGDSTHVPVVTIDAQGRVTALTTTAIAGGTSTGLKSVADANYTMVAADANVAYTTLTASRTLTLPAANTLGAGQEIVVLDASGNASATVTISVARAGSDTIDGATTSLVIEAPYGQVRLRSDGVSNWYYDARAALIVDVFDANGTWYKRNGCVAVDSWVIGGGGGGGGGRCGAAASNRNGGGGGGGASASYSSYVAAGLPSSLAVTVGAGGTAGAAAGTAAANGGAGGTGGASTFGAIGVGQTVGQSSVGGNGGTGGTSASGTAGTGASIPTSVAQTSLAGTAGGAGGTTTGSPAATLGNAGLGGGGGCGITSANAQGAISGAGLDHNGQSNPAGVGSGPGNAGATDASGLYGSSGSGGFCGDTAATVSGTAGGTGGIGCGGGGGGGATSAGTASSGPGGVGGPGRVIVWNWMKRTV